jgi:hypothetical protein
LLYIGTSGTHFIATCFADEKQIKIIAFTDQPLYEFFVKLYQEHGITLPTTSKFHLMPLEKGKDFFENLQLKEVSHSPYLFLGGNGASPTVPGGAEQTSTSSAGHIIVSTAAAVGGGLVGRLIVKNLLGRILARRKQELLLGRKQALAEGKSTKAIDRELALLSSNTLSFKDKAMIAASAVFAAAVVGGSVCHAGASRKEK